MIIIGAGKLWLNHKIAWDGIEYYRVFSWKLRRRMHQKDRSPSAEGTWLSIRGWIVWFAKDHSTRGGEIMPVNSIGQTGGVQFNSGGGRKYHRHCTVCNKVTEHAYINGKITCLKHTERSKSAEPAKV